MSRRRLKMGPIGIDRLTGPHQELRVRSSLEADYSLPRPTLMRVVQPLVTTIVVTVTNRDQICGENIEITDEEKRRKLIAKLDEEKKKKGKPPTEGNPHIQFHLAFGSQLVYHHPLHKDDDNGAEADPAVLQGDVTVVLHDETGNGFELTYAIQGAVQYFFVDPNRNNPNEIASGRKSNQLQQQFQVSYVFSDLVLGFDFSILAQLFEQWSYQYSPDERRATINAAWGAAFGVGFDLPLTKHLKWSTQFTLGTTQIPGHSTLDPGVFTGLKAEF
jgi:hypothetical protein